MQKANFTLLNLKDDFKTFSVGKENEPQEVLPNKDNKDSQVEIELEEKSELQPEKELMNHGVEVVPEKPEIDEEFLKQGVETGEETSIFVQNRKIELPLSVEKLEEGLHKPITSGWRWLAELTKYILGKFHLTIKKIGGVFKLVPRE